MLGDAAPGSSPSGPNAASRTGGPIMTPTPRLLSIATAVPSHVLRQDEVRSAAARLFTGHFERFSRLEAVYANAQIETRYSCVPLTWYAEPHGFTERNRLFIDNAVDLLDQAARTCLRRA